MKPHIEVKHKEKVVVQWVTKHIQSYKEANAHLFLWISLGSLEDKIMS